MEVLTVTWCMGTQDSSTPFEGDAGPDATEVNAGWVIAKSLLAANDRTAALLEHLVLDAYTDASRDRGPDANADRLALVQAELERAIEDLELARSMAARLDATDE